MSGLFLKASSTCFCRSSSCSRSDFRSARLGDLEDLEQRQQRHVVVVRVGAGDEMPRALEQVLQPQQRPDALVQRVFVGDHGLANCRYFGAGRRPVCAMRHACRRCRSRRRRRRGARRAGLRARGWRAPPASLRPRSRTRRDLLLFRAIHHQHAVDAPAVVAAIRPAAARRAPRRALRRRRCGAPIPRGSSDAAGPRAGASLAGSANT